MSHILDEELHAYLDQALSRSQCVVIESHLAACPVCRAARDAIAALRDRTTLLLGTLAPARRIPPALEELRRRQAVQPLPRRARMLRNATMAASLVGALGLGYALRTLSGNEAQPARRAVQDVALTPSATTEAAAPATASHGTHGRVRSVPRERDAVLPEVRGEAPVAPSPSIEFSTDTLPNETDQALTGFWRTVPWDGVREAVGSEPSRVMGVPVEEVQMQPSRQQGARPVTMVAQRLSSGEVIQTIEGSAADISQLLSRRGDGGLDSAGRPAEAMQRGDRMIVVTGQLPPDSLRALVRRVNAAMRVR